VNGAGRGLTHILSQLLADHEKGLKVADSGSLWTTEVWMLWKSAFWSMDSRSDSERPSHSPAQDCCSAFQHLLVFQRRKGQPQSRLSLHGGSFSH